MAKRIDLVRWAVASTTPRPGRQGVDVCIAGARREDARRLKEADELVLRVRVVEIPPRRQRRRG